MAGGLFCESWLLLIKQVLGTAHWIEAVERAGEAHWIGVGDSMELRAGLSESNWELERAASCSWCIYDIFLAAVYIWEAATKGSISMS